MPSVESIVVLMLAPVAALAGWFIATRGRRGRVVPGLGGAVSSALIVVAVAGIFTGRPTALRVFALDASASARGAPAAAWPAIRSAAARLPDSARVAVVAFGRDAVTLVPPTAPADLPAALPPPGGVDQDGTSFARALEAADSLFAPGARGDVVIVTDGCETEGEAAQAALRLAAERRPVHSLTLRAEAGPDAWIASVRAPAVVAAGQPIDFEVVAGATAPMHGKLVLLANGRELTGPEPIDVLSRSQVFARRAAAVQPGLCTLTARLLCPGDAVSENNEASAAVRVRGKVSILLVSEGQSSALAALLEQSGALALRRAVPDALEPTTGEMLADDVIVLDNVSARALGGPRIDWLRRFVADAGRGLVVFGGPDSFGSGGYAKTALADLLPVDVDPERRAAEPASVLLIADRSGSMAERVGGMQKIEFVREAVLRAEREFGGRARDKSDELSVIAFNQAAETLLDRQVMGTPTASEAVRTAAARLFPSGRTNLNPPLDAARAVLAKSALKRHIIIISDGQCQDKLDGPRLAREMKAAGITVSVLATGREMNDGLAALKQAADATGGRFIALESVAELPAAMARETRTIAGPLVREGDFAVSRGPGAAFVALSALPAVKGYVLTGPRPEAPPALLASDAPLLAAWPRGLGRVAACTTSLDRWAADWPAAAPGLPESVVLWAGGAVRPESLAVELEAAGDALRITALAASPLAPAALGAAVFAPDGSAADLVLKQTGRLRYEGTTHARTPGTYVVRVGGLGARSSGGGAGTVAGAALGEGHITIGYSPEWRPDRDPTGARRISALTSGVVLKTLDDLPPLEPGGGSDDARRSLAWLLLTAAALIFVLSSLKS